MIEGSLIAGKYRVKRRIGAGGMGAVYEGEHVEIGKRVAIKVIEHEHARSEELAARFRREARAASAVESEHIVHVFDVGQDEKLGLYMVMEFLVGEDLASRLEKAGGRIPVDEAVTIATQSGRALAKAHAAGVVHRDLKPANLFLTTREDGTTSVKILDFGISKLVRPGSDAKASSLTREGSVMGTPTYMSPEQAQGLAVDARSDVWSLASVLYEALAGVTPYEPRDTYEQMIIQIVTKKPRPIEEIAPWVPAPIARVIEAALVHDVDVRTPDAALFARTLAEAARLPVEPVSSRDVAAAASTSSPASSAGSPPTGIGVVVGARDQATPEARRRPNPGMRIAGAVAVLAVVVGLVALLTRDPAGAKAPAQGGLVATPPSEPAPVGTTSSASSASSASTILPASAASAASAEPSAAPSPKAAAASANARDDGGVKAATRPAAATTGATPKVGPTQYGAAGVSTAY